MAIRFLIINNIDFARQIKSLGECIDASDNKNAIEIIDNSYVSKKMFDIVFVKADDSGVGLLKYLKARNITENLPVIFVDSKFSDDFFDEVINEDAEDFVLESNSQPLIVARIKHCLKKIINEKNSRVEKITQAEHILIQKIAGAIKHNFNQPLTVIIGDIELAKTLSDALLDSLKELIISMNKLPQEEKLEMQKEMQLKTIDDIESLGEKVKHHHKRIKSNLITIRNEIKFIGSKLRV